MPHRHCWKFPQGRDHVTLAFWPRHPGLSSSVLNLIISARETLMRCVHRGSKLERVHLLTEAVVSCLNVEFQREGLSCTGDLILSWLDLNILSQSSSLKVYSASSASSATNPNLESVLLTTPVREQVTPTSTRGKGAKLVLRVTSASESRAEWSRLGSLPHAVSDWATEKNARGQSL